MLEKILRLDLDKKSIILNVTELRMVEKYPLSITVIFKDELLEGKLIHFDTEEQCNLYFERIIRSFNEGI